jgi:hypothetical protein
MSIRLFEWDPPLGKYFTNVFVFQLRWRFNSMQQVRREFMPRN